MMTHAQKIREGLEKMRFEGKPRFIILDDGDKNCLPVVTAMLNPEFNFEYDDIDLQHAISEHNWYVSGYKMNFEDPITKQGKPIFTDQDGLKTMFRVVVKNNINAIMVDNLIDSFGKTLEMLDSIEFKNKSNGDFKGMHRKKHLSSKHLCHVC